MILYKIWLETRIRAATMLVIILASAYRASLKGPDSYLWIFTMYLLMTPVMLAGAGIRTECPLRAWKGESGSLYFTLSLPVSRMRLFAARVGVCVTLTVSVALGAVAFGVIFPGPYHPSLSLAIQYFASVVVCILPALGMSTLASVYFDQQWQTFLGMGGTAALWWIVSAIPGSARFDPVRAVSIASVLKTHQMPWPAMGLAAAIGAALIALAAIALQRRNY